LFGWCPRPESNRHILGWQIFLPLRLSTPPRVPTKRITTMYNFYMLTMFVVWTVSCAYCFHQVSAFPYSLYTSNSIFILKFGSALSYVLPHLEFADFEKIHQRLSILWLLTHKFFDGAQIKMLPLDNDLSISLLCLPIPPHGQLFKN
jgi:hypothetical protein